MILKYKERKAKGLINLTIQDGIYYASIRRFDPDDGTELPPQIVDLPLPQLRAERDHYQIQVDELSELINDAEKL